MMTWMPNADSTGDVLYGAFGHFTVGDKKFHNNFTAMKESKISKKPINWNYYDEVWQDAHALGLWRNTTLPSLYGQRARQLRQKYEHVSVLFSGGWDSRNILDTFERERLKINCIVIYGIPDLAAHTPRDNLNPINWYGEIEYHALPYARAYCARNPGTKLIEIPWVERTIAGYANPETLLEESRPKPGFWFGRSMAVSSAPDLLRDLGSKKGCLISGVDKPCIIHNDGATPQGFFPEGIFRFLTYPTKSLGFQDNHIWEAFYWTPDLPELAIRGWYELWSLCKRNSAVASAHNTANDRKQRFKLKMSRYVQDTMRSMLYKQFDPTAWQADKQDEWGFFMTYELPVIKIMNERGIKWAEMLGEVLIEMTNQAGEDNLIIGHETDYNSAPWVKKLMSDQNTVLDYKTYFGEFIDLDTNFNC